MIASPKGRVEPSTGFLGSTWAPTTDYHAIRLEMVGTSAVGLGLCNITTDD